MRCFQVDVGKNYVRRRRLEHVTSQVILRRHKKREYLPLGGHTAPALNLICSIATARAVESHDNDLSEVGDVRHAREGFAHGTTVGTGGAHPNYFASPEGAGHVLWFGSFCAFRRILADVVAVRVQHGLCAVESFSSQRPMRRVGIVDRTAALHRCPGLLRRLQPHGQILHGTTVVVRDLQLGVNSRCELILDEGVSRGVIDDQVEWQLHALGHHGELRYDERDSSTLLWVLRHALGLVHLQIFRGPREHPFNCRDATALRPCGDFELDARNENSRRVRLDELPAQIDLVLNRQRKSTATLLYLPPEYHLVVRCIAALAFKGAYYDFAEEGDLRRQHPRVAHSAALHAQSSLNYINANVFVATIDRLGPLAYGFEVVHGRGRLANSKHLAQRLEDRRRFHGNPYYYFLVGLYLY